MERFEQAGAKAACLLLVMMIHDAFSPCLMIIDDYSLSLLEFSPACTLRCHTKRLNVTEALSGFKGRCDHRKAHMTFVTFLIDRVFI